MDKVEAFRASDGTLFLSEKEAAMYEKKLVEEQRMQKFLESPGNTMRKLALNEKLVEFLHAWEAWKALYPQK